MKIIKFKVSGQEQIRLTHESIVAGSQNYLACAFSFDDPDYEGKTKIANFVYGDQVFSQLIKDGTCEVPPEVIQPPYFTMSLTIGDLITIKPVTVTVDANGLPDGVYPVSVTLGLYEQMIAEFTQHSESAKASADRAESQAETASLQAKQAAQSAEQAAQSADQANTIKTDCDTILQSVGELKAQVDADAMKSAANAAQAAESKAECEEIQQNIQNIKSGMDTQAEAVSEAAASAAKARDDAQTALSEVLSAKEDIIDIADTKVDKVDGKGLSQNDYSDADKALVSGMPDALLLKADKADVLEKTNSDAYTPTSDYHPATKKYVDDTAEKPENKGRAGGYAPLDENGKLPDSYLYGVTVKQYGVRWNGTSSTVCERLGDAVGLVANAHKGTADSVQNDFDSIYPWSDMKLCNIDADGNILAFADEPSFQRDGTNGDVMVRIPKFYYKREKTAEGCEEWWICAVKLPGYALHPLFMDDGKEVSEVFHSAYNASSYTDETDSKIKLQSITGVQPKVRTTRSNFRTYARNKGSVWGIEDLSCVHALQMLYMVEYANTNSQAALGSGVSSLNYTALHLAVEAGENTNEFVTSTANANKYRVGERIEIGTSQGSNNKTSTPRTITAITARDDDADISVITFDGDPVASIAVGNMIWNVAPLNGSCDELGGGSGYIGTNGRADSAYRGIEGFHGKLFRFIDGVNIKDHVVYYANSIADYADGVYDGKYRAVGYTNGTSNGYVSEFGYDEKAPWVMFPTEAKGGSTTYVPDYYYQTTGERLLTLGGSFSFGDTYDGVFCFYGINAFSYLILSYGAHLLVKKP